MVRVSFLMSVYADSEELVIYATTAIQSIINQTFKEWELVIVNDNPSYEPLCLMLDKIATSDSRIKVLKNVENCGLLQSLNNGISYIVGGSTKESDYIARMDADDISHPERLQRQVDFMQLNKNVDVVGTPIIMFNTSSSLDSSTPTTGTLDNSKEMVEKEWSGKGLGKKIEHPNGGQGEHAIWSMHFNCCLVHPTVMFRTSSVIKLIKEKKGLYRMKNGLKNVEDYTLWLRMIRKGMVLDNLPAGTPPLLILRKHNNNISKQNIEDQKKATAEVSLLHYLKLKSLNQESNTNNNINIDWNVMYTLHHPSLVNDPILIEKGVGVVLDYERFITSLYPHISKESLADHVNERYGELVAILMAKFPQYENVNKLWSSWVSRNPTSQIMSLLNLNNNNSSNNNNINNENSILNLIGGIGNNNNNNNNSNKNLKNGIKVICFSKDRAFQLREYLRTFYFYNRNTNPEQFPIDVFVLYAYSKEEFGKSYDQVQSEYPQVNFIKETNFTTQIKEMVETSQYKYIVFGVDDILYYNHFDLSLYCSRLEQHPDALGFYIKLNPTITYCHTCNENIQVPNLQEYIDQDNNNNNSNNLIRNKYYKWNRLDDVSKRDWNYPFDLCSTVYRLSTVKLIMSSIIKYLGIKQGISHPNRLECNGNRVIIQKQYSQQQPMCLCESDHVMSMITINRVQDIYTNPVYTNESDQELNQLQEVEQLDKLLTGVPTRHLDDHQYFTNRSTLKSCHIGEFYLSNGNK